MAGTLDAKVWTSNNGAAGWGDDGKLYQTLDVTAASNEVGGTGWKEMGANLNAVGSEANFPPTAIVSSAYVPKNGAELSRDAYPALYQFAVNTGCIVDEATWQGLKTTAYNGAVSAYSSGDGSTTFRVPTVGLSGGFARAMGTDGTYSNSGFESQIQDHKHVTTQFAGISNASNFVSDDANYWGSLTLSSLGLPAVDVVNVGESTALTNPSWGLALTSPETYDNSGETHPQGQYVSVWIYTGNDTSAIPTPDPSWLIQQSVNTNTIATNTPKVLSSDAYVTAMQARTWQNVTSSRAAGVTYTNNTGYDIEVVVTSDYNDTSSSLNLKVDSKSIAMSRVATGTSWSGWVGAKVNPGSSYSLVSSKALLIWSELR